MGYFYYNLLVQSETLTMTSSSQVVRLSMEIPLRLDPQISEHLGLPVISYAQDIKVEGDSCNRTASV